MNIKIESAEELRDAIYDQYSDPSDGRYVSGYEMLRALQDFVKKGYIDLYEISDATRKDAMKFIPETVDCILSKEAKTFERTRQLGEQIKSELKSSQMNQMWDEQSQ